MAGVAAFCDAFQPDFGLPWDRDYETALAALSDEEVFALLAFKQWFEGRQTITAPELAAGQAKLSPAARRLALRTIAEKNALVDPVDWGWTLESWREVGAEFTRYMVHCIFGGNRAGKSSMVARLVVWCALHIPEFRCRCYQVNEDKSISEQQAFIWEALPQRFKSMGRRKGQNYTVQYTQQNGFVGGKLIIPPLPGYKRGGEILFGNYQQYKNDPQVVEGWWAHLIWCDEEVPQKMFERLLTRLGDARGRLMLTFTTVQGWSPLVAEILGKTRTLRRRFSEMLKREIPVAQESLNRNSTRIYYFWTQDNPFIPPEWIYQLMANRPAEEIKAIAHGIPSRSATTPFPKFDEAVHVLPADRLPWLHPRTEEESEAEFTRYQVIDPSGSKPWFVIWAAVDAAGKIYVYRESPDPSAGAWAEPGNSLEGKAGPAQKPNGWGIDDYRDLFAHAEQGEEIFERVIDPRLGAATTQAKEGATSIISELDRAGLTTVPAPGLQIEHGIQLINDRLGFDAGKPISALNTPRLFISADCGNLVDAFKNYTGKGGKDEAHKDPVDCVRYLLENGADFVAKSEANAGPPTFSY